MNKNERIGVFVQEIWHWYAQNKRSLPWRDLCITDENERGYRIMVSEIMLQQTQVPRVMVTYKEFLRKFPFLRDLAHASNKDVILAWRGMGYNNRAIRLRDAARFLCERGGFPTDMEELMTIPGVGHYTAAAIRNFAFNIPTPCLDTNIRRIFHRTFIGPENADGTWEKNDAYLLKLAGEVLEEALGKSEIKNQKLETNQKLKMKKCKNNISDFRFQISDFRCDAAAWHAALMDFGSLVQTKRNPKWEHCPLTAKGIMKTTPENMPLYDAVARERKKKREPGRMIGSRHIPNRIFRGKIVESLRDHHAGLTLQEIGKEICIDWNGDNEQNRWLCERLESLKKDQLVMEQKKKFFLRV